MPRYSFRFDEATIGDLQARMESGRLSSRALVRAYLRRIDTIDRAGPGRLGLRSVLEVNPDAERIAATLDEERRHEGPRGPLHGIPVLVKDNMDSADRLHTSAGSLALDRSPSGSSSGSAAAVAANLATAALGTETDGSILCPAAACCVVGIKPTVGLTSRAGVIPISHSQDTVGPICRTVSDAAIVLGALVGVDPRDPATRESEARSHTNYRRFLDAGGLHGARIGIPREVYYDYSPPANQVAEQAIAALESAGAEVVDPADIPGAKEMAGFTGERELEVLLYELKHDLDEYMAEREDPRIRSLADVIAFNQAHAAAELQHFGQEFFLAAQEKGPLTEPAYLEALAANRRLARQGIEKLLEDLRLDALLVPTSAPPWTIDLVNGDHVLGEGSTPAALAGYPAVTVPAGYADGLPVGVTFFGTAWSEPTLIRLAYAFEQATKVRHPPRFHPGGLDHKVRS